MQADIDHLRFPSCLLKPEERRCLRANYSRQTLFVFNDKFLWMVSTADSSVPFCTEIYLMIGLLIRVVMRANLSYYSLRLRGGADFDFPHCSENECKWTPPASFLPSASQEGRRCLGPWPGYSKEANDPALCRKVCELNKVHCKHKTVPLKRFSKSFQVTNIATRNLFEKAAELHLQRLRIFLINQRHSRTI